jgi:hypothetical protein
MVHVTYETTGVREAEAHAEASTAGGRKMRHEAVIGLLVLLFATLIAPGICAQEPCRSVWSGADCCIDLGLRVVLSVSGGEIQGSVLLPHVGAGRGGREGSGSTWFGRAGIELVRVALYPADVVRWTIPIVSILAEVRSSMEASSGMGASSGIEVAPRTEREPARQEELLHADCS